MSSCVQPCILLDEAFLGSDGWTKRKKEKGRGEIQEVRHFITQLTCRIYLYRYIYTTQHSSERCWGGGHTMSPSTFDPVASTQRLKGEMLGVFLTVSPWEKRQVYLGGQTRCPTAPGPCTKHPAAGVRGWGVGGGGDGGWLYSGPHIHTDIHTSG